MQNDWRRFPALLSGGQVPHPTHNLNVDQLDLYFISFWRNGDECTAFNRKPDYPPQGQGLRHVAEGLR